MCVLQKFAVAMTSPGNPRGRESVALSRSGANLYNRRSAKPALVLGNNTSLAEIMVGFRCRSDGAEM